MIVYKWGRTTGVTKGIVSRFDSTVNLNEMERNLGAEIARPTGPDGKPVVVDVLDEWIVDPKSYRNAIGERVTPDFVNPGDSGSLIVDEDGHVVGLLWGATGIGGFYVTDIRVVFQTICSYLGGSEDHQILGIATHL